MTDSPSAPPQARGRRTRDAILGAAEALFADRGPAAVSVADIAAAAGAHPNQITYYFGSKDALFVEAAFRLLLRQAQRLEPIGLRRRTPESFRAALARTALALPAVPIAVHAMSVSRLRPELHASVQQSLAVLFRQAEGYLVDVLDRRGWTIDRPADLEVRTFWTTVFGARVITEGGYRGESADVDLAGVLTVRARPDAAPAPPGRE
ncbi:TetR/AcrR family transcriptional regulator C-terminal domain-containing protein [Actinoplanes sp. NPDC020271]|uniref:TetR/AcrR family transcriptional regulator C-terminal domain-containing protein n=1 Tax=Actinoplanes sp. NPDC020271 TaxID=3363896 RepID=UPI00378EA624